MNRQCLHSNFFTTAGTNQGTQSVSISTATSEATIHYTLDGTTPAESSSICSSPISVSTNTTIKAAAWKSGSTPSNVASETYIIVKTVLTSIMVSPSSVIHY